jgi:AcrR family transcriptional regulator
MIIEAADELIRRDGYNAFSYKDISDKVGIKTASIHYHFPTKTDLGIAVIDTHTHRFRAFEQANSMKSPLQQLELFLALYSTIKCEDKVCIVGSLATDLNTVDEQIKGELKKFAALVLGWVTMVLDMGRKQRYFAFEAEPRTKALMVITNILAIVQLSRLTGDEDFEIVRTNILQELKPKKL